MMSVLGLVCALATTTLGQAMKPGVYYVRNSVLEERLAPGPTGTVTNRIYLQQKVDVFEVKNGWARVSKYYDGAVEGQEGQVARWVLATGLSPTLPPLPKQPRVQSDPRIAKDAFPKVGENGLTERDIEILRKGALKLLNSGKCDRVEYGDKSVSKPNTYYVTCGGQNVFFTAAEVQ